MGDSTKVGATGFWVLWPGYIKQGKNKSRSGYAGGDSAPAPAITTVRTSEPVRPLVLSAAWIALTYAPRRAICACCSLIRSCKDTTAGDSLLVNSARGRPPPL